MYRKAYKIKKATSSERVVYMTNDGTNGLYSVAIIDDEQFTCLSRFKAVENEFPALVEEAAHGNKILYFQHDLTETQAATVIQAAQELRQNPSFDLEYFLRTEGVPL